MYLSISSDGRKTPRIKSHMLCEHELGRKFAALDRSVDKKRMLQTSLTVICEWKVERA